MKRDAAETVVRMFLTATGELNEALKVIQAETPDAVFKEYRKHTGEIMAAIYLDLIKRVVREYPDLDPVRERDGEA